MPRWMFDREAPWPATGPYGQGRRGRWVEVPQLGHTCNTLGHCGACGATYCNVCGHNCPDGQHR